jgi:hypothetical protein
MICHGMRLRAESGPLLRVAVAQSLSSPCFVGSLQRDIAPAGIIAVIRSLSNVSTIVEQISPSSRALFARQSLVPASQPFMLARLALLNDSKCQLHSVQGSGLLHRRHSRSSHPSTGQIPQQSGQIIFLQVVH